MNRHRIAMDGAQFSFQQSALGSPRGERELSASAMSEIVDSLSVTEKQYRSDLTKQANKYFFLDSSGIAGITPPVNTGREKFIYSRCWTS